MFITTQQKQETVRGNSMSEEVQTAGFIVRFWQELLVGLALSASALYFRSKGKEAPVYLDEDDIEQRMMLCRHELKEVIMFEFEKKLDRAKTDMLREIQLMIQAANK